MAITANREWQAIDEQRADQMLQRAYPRRSQDGGYFPQLDLSDITPPAFDYRMDYAEYFYLRRPYLMAFFLDPF